MAFALSILFFVVLGLATVFGQILNEENRTGNIMKLSKAEPHLFEGGVADKATVASPDSRTRELPPLLSPTESEKSRITRL